MEQVERGRQTEAVHESWAIPRTGLSSGSDADSAGVNFALYSRTAQEVFPLLSDEPSGVPFDVIRVEKRRRFIWHVFVHGLRAGQLNGYKVLGDLDPARGLRFNPHELLLDPYAKTSLPDG
jgi:isoamylase